MNRDRLLRALCLLVNSKSSMDWNDEVDGNLTRKPPKTTDEGKHAQAKRLEEEKAQRDEEEKAQREEEERLMREREKEERAKLDDIQQAKLELAEHTQNPLVHLPPTTTPTSGTTFAKWMVPTATQASLYAAQMGAISKHATPFGTGEMKTPFALSLSPVPSEPEEKHQRPVPPAKPDLGRAVDRPEPRYKEAPARNRQRRDDYETSSDDGRSTSRETRRPTYRRLRGRDEQARRATSRSHSRGRRSDTSRDSPRRPAESGRRGKSVEYRRDLSDARDRCRDLGYARERSAERRRDSRDTRDRRRDLSYARERSAERRDDSRDARDRRRDLSYARERSAERRRDPRDARDRRRDLSYARERSAERRRDSGETRDRRRDLSYTRDPSPWRRRDSRDAHGRDRETGRARERSYEYRRRRSYTPERRREPSYSRDRRRDRSRADDTRRDERDRDGYDDDRRQWVTGDHLTKILKDWKLNFAGNDSAKANAYLNRLRKCRMSARIDDDELMRTIPITLSDVADVWYYANYPKFRDWRDFEQSFRANFIGVQADYTVLCEWRNREQAEGEPIAQYFTFFRYYLNHLVTEPSRQEQVENAWNNIRAEYRDALNNRMPYTVDEIEREGMRYEQSIDIERRKKKRVVDSLLPASVRTMKFAPKVAALHQAGSTDSEKSSEATSSSPSRRKRNRGRGKGKATREAAAITAGASPPCNPSDGTASNAQARTSDEPRSRFVGACYTCSETGHHANKCPRRQCFSCKKTGHLAAACPEAPAPRKRNCQRCNEPNCDFETCQRCAPYRQAWENANAGRTSGSATSPPN
ncbi:unnamed protein product [Trichogramma brassicae]|uniref:CCHC-type domain-containing protein n=1 Tax=Trichogramma brassicae TaxID=86971 RepID=A0A6H5I7F4_9HYME|nr:unnamed protein product [Trichogramma brassicae]